MFAHAQLKCYIIVVTRALVFCLICTPSSLGPAAGVPAAGVHIRQNTRARVTTIKLPKVTTFAA